jgi:hypothetical protein
MTRGNDNGMAPCVDEQVAMANALSSPNAIASIRTYTAKPADADSS